MKKSSLHQWILGIGSLLSLMGFAIHSSLSSIYAESSKSSYTSRVENGLSYIESADQAKLASVKYSLEDMLRLKSSVSEELRDLEMKRRKILDELAALTKIVNDTKLEILKVQGERDKVHKSLEQAKLMRMEAMEKNTPEMVPPLQLLPSFEDSTKRITDSASQLCRFESCFEYAQCPSTGVFSIFLYPLNPQADEESALWYRHLRDSGFVTDDPKQACIYFAIDEKDVTALKFWRGDGRNHIIVNPSITSHPRNISRAIYASLYASNHRLDYDIILPYTQESFELLSLPPVSPARRKYLLSFQGELGNPTKEELIVIAILKKLQLTITDDKFLVHFECLSDLHHGETDEYAICGTDSSREQILKESTFSLILAPQGAVYTSTNSVQKRLFESLKLGSVPVIMGPLDLPFSNEIDWKKAAIFLPKARASELHFLLRTIPDAEILNMRRMGRVFWEKYLSVFEVAVQTLIGSLRDKIGLPPPPAKQVHSQSVFNASFVPLKTDPPPSDEEVDEYLGPIEPPSPSATFLRNYTFTSVNSYERWNQWIEPFTLYPYTPFDPVVPSEARFVGSSTGYRPVNGGAGGAGKEFSEVIGGNRPREQFTVVMLAYERDQVMMASLGRLNEVPYLNKVIVVWNSRKPPAEDMKWPDIGVPIVVVRTEKNSLNNRFLPFDEIETEAILSVDDDVHLRHDEIVFGFRVWREQRDRIVGFPGRFHAWDTLFGGWHYNSNYSCELSMVLTGAAFFHKYYTYLYTYSMPQVIRDKVDEYMNCEDLAMNFLVSHYTRQPPVKVTNRWTFRCPGCPVTLSEDETHFEERHKCMNFFTKVYGYMPLLNTQFRVDSVLSKTRIPHDKQKCFKYV